MNTKLIAYLLVFSFVLASGGVAYGAIDDTRYLVKSSSGFWKKSFGTRHEFKEGFTADLSDWQLRVARVFGIEVVPVGKLFILQESTLEPENKPVAKPTPAPSLRVSPSSQIPWGIKAIYNNDPMLTETSEGEGVNVAVLDTGVYKAHPDLENRVKQCKDFTAAKLPVVDGKCDDKNGHGTHVAGVIAADGGTDGKGIYGIAPQAEIFAYKVCGNNGSCWSDDIAGAIRTAVTDGAHIINLSLGSDANNSLISEAVEYAVAEGVLVVAAAGNDGPDEVSIDYPAADPNVVAVGAFNKDGKIEEWSSRGNNSETEEYVVNEKDVEFAAPGSMIESTWKDGGYVILSGTSMATPHIAGLAAKLWQRDAVDTEPSLATRLLLQKFAKDEDISDPGDDNFSGFGFPHIY